MGSENNFDFEIEVTNRLDIFWLRDESLEESDNLSDPGVLAREIVGDLEAALEQFREIAAGLAKSRLQKKINR